MGKGNIANLVHFKPGQSGNPSGRAGVLPPEIRKERKKNQAGLIRMITDLFSMNEEAFEAKIKAKETTTLERAAIAMIGKANEGDVPAFKFLMEVMVGKIPEHDYDGWTEEDLRMLNRVKELMAETRPDGPGGTSNQESH